MDIAFDMLDNRRALRKEPLHIKVVTDSVVLIFAILRTEKHDAKLAKLHTLGD
jgi:hypothetical protein